MTTRRIVGQILSLMFLGTVGLTANRSLFSAAAAPVPAESITSQTIVAKRTTDKIKDLVTTLVVKDDETNRDELKKIGGAFATTYSVKRMSVSYKFPNKARFEGKAAGISALLVYNADSKMFKIPIPFVGKKIQNVKGQPGQKQSLLDLGIFAKDWLTTDWEPHFLGNQNGLDQYKLTQRDTFNHSYEMVSVNPKTFIIEQRKSYNGDKILQKELRFRNPVQVSPGIWIPTRIEVLNQYGKIGAVQTLQGTRVNGGVSDDLFQIS
jgi:outer membrane lipoprotein-sorting protein